MGTESASAFLPRYVRTKKSHLWHTNNHHLHLWAGRVFNEGVGKGITLKKRLRPNFWRHYSVSIMRYASRENGAGTVRHFEVGYHDSHAASGERIRMSKRYIRVKVCL